MSYRDALNWIVTNIWSTVMVSLLPVPEFILPSSWLEVKGRAK
jgi:hypothetical protein